MNETPAIRRFSTHCVPRNVRQRAAGWAWMLIVLLVGPTIAVPVQAAIPQSERDVLIALYDGTDGENWIDNTGWNGAPGTECSWDRVHCDPGETHVTDLQLGTNNLIGSLPPIAALTHLEIFYVYSNQLAGPIPPLASLTNLKYFDAYDNQLSGPIPSLAGLNNLDSFDVYGNQLSGPIPSLAALARIRFFAVDNNQLSGPIPSLSALTNLEFFLAGNNEFSGSIPSLASLTSLHVFSVDQNQLSGDIPDVPSSNFMIAGESQLCPNFLNPTPNAAWDAATGETPWYQNCTAAAGTIPAGERQVLLDLFDSTNGNNWTNNTGWNGAPGSECSWYGIACDDAEMHVEGVDLGSNNLVGSLPPIAGLTKLQSFFAYDNQLSGPIPSLAGLTNLHGFFVYENQLSGPIPSLAGLTNLDSFAASDNQLSGSIPSLAGRTNLVTFEVARNQLSGAIPSLAGLTNLQYFFVQDNQLSGDIPDVPSPSNLVPGFSRLCPNLLNPTPNAAWDAATGETPWYQNCTAGTPTLAVTGVSPASSGQGTNVPVSISGAGFDASTTFGFGSGIAVNSLSIINTTSATATLAISVSATLGARTVTALRDSDQSNASLPNGFTVTFVTPPPPPDLGLVSVSPSSGVQGTNVPITISGSGFDSTTTFAFGSGITVNNPSVTSATNATATLAISPSAALGARTVTAMRTSDESSASLPNGFTVVASTPDLGLVSIAPWSGTQGTNVPVTIAGTGFNAATTFTFGSGSGINVVGTSITSATSASATLQIAASAATGPRTLTATRSSDGSSAALPGGFMVLADEPEPPPPSGSVVLLLTTNSPGPFGAGDELTYTLSLGNGSGADLSGVRVTAQGPANRLDVTAADCNATLTDGGIDWSVGALADGAVATCAFEARVTALDTTCASNCTIAVAATTTYGSLFFIRVSTRAVVGVSAAPQTLSVRPGGAPTTRDSVEPALSADGGVVAFSSDQKDLAPGNTNTQGADIYLRDRNGLRLVSRTDEGQLRGTNRDVAIALNGSALAFIHEPGSDGAALDAEEKGEGYAILCVSQPLSPFQFCPVIGVDDAAPNGDMESPSLSADGKLVAFCSSATNLVEGDTNGKKDVFVTEVRVTPGPMRRMSVTADGQQGDGDSCAPMLSGNGRYVVFTTKAANLGGSADHDQVMRKDLVSGEITLITQNEGTPADEDAGPPSVSADGQRIAYASRARNLVTGVANGRRNVFVYDGRGEAGTRRLAKADTTNNTFVMLGAGGQLPNGDSADPKLACGGNALGVSSEASNLVPGDNNLTRDVFAYGLDSDRIVRVTQPNGGGSSQNAALDCDATTGAYDSNDTPNGNADVIAGDEPLRSDQTAIVLDESYSGNWYNPGQSGHGFLLEALPNGTFYATWYVYQNGQPLFLQGQGVPAGNRLDVDMYSVTSTAFPIGPGRPTVSDWGRVTFTFTSSNDGMASWQPVAAGFTAGSTNLRRLSNASRIESDRDGVLSACYSGIWYDRARSGFGFDVEFNETVTGGRKVQVFWYTYQPDGSPLWLIGVGEATPGGVILDLIQLGGTGAQFPPAFSADAVTRTPWGTATLTFSPNRLDVSYNSVLPGYGSGTLSGLQRLTVLDQRECAP